MQTWLELYNEYQGYRSMIPSGIRESLAYPAIFLPVLFVWLYLIVRSNETKRLGHLFLSIALLVGCSVLLHCTLAYSLSTGLILALSAFTICLFRSFSLLTTVLAGTMLAFGLGLFRVDNWPEYSCHIIAGTLPYGFYLFCCAKFGNRGIKRISDKYTSSGYSISEISVFVFILSLSFFACMLGAIISLIL